MSELKIPDDVWENRCRWCLHRLLDENFPVPLEFSHRVKMPCQILGVAKPGAIPGECGSFAPNHIYGICATCTHDRNFHYGFCDAPSQPNKRQIYTGQGYQNKAYWAVHRLSTCDNYKPWPNLFEAMRKQAAEGKIPRNFDPVTMEPTEELNSTKWAELEDGIRAEKKQQAREKEIRDAERMGQIPGQQMMDI